MTCFIRAQLTDVERHAPALLVNLDELLGIAFDETFERVADDYDVI